LGRFDGVREVGPRPLLFPDESLPISLFNPLAKAIAFYEFSKIFKTLTFKNI